MNILTIDTSTETEIIAACSKLKYSNQSTKIAESHSKTIFKNINIALNKINLKINDINLIGVGIGPGSFTGIRIAVTTARMLAQILKIPLVSLSTPQLFAAAIPARPAENILIAFDAKKKRIFGALYKAAEDNLNPRVIIPAGDYYIDDMLNQIDSKKVHCYGNGILKYRINIKNSVKKLVEYTDYIPAAEKICKLTKYTYLNNPEKYKHIYNILPDYTRKSDAEAAKNIKLKP